MTDLSKIVVSTRVRLARNIEGYVFPLRLQGEKHAREIVRLVTSGLSRVDGFQDDQFKVYYMSAISDGEAQMLMENHLISPNLIKNKRISAAVINNDESISIMINEEDHLREQCILKGMELETAYHTMAQIDARLSNSMKFAFDEQLGYLTACPTNLGTGLRASVMAFLPALTINGLMPKIYRSISRLGLTLRGVYGEGSEAEGYMYQISNEVTLGVTEREILKQVSDVVTKVAELEEAERLNIKKGDSSLDVKDGCLRALGVLTSCAKLSTNELLKLSASVKFGACLGYINIPDVSAIDDLVVKMRPANINAAAGKELSSLARDEYRADYVTKHIKQMMQGGN